MPNNQNPFRAGAAALTRKPLRVSNDELVTVSSITADQALPLLVTPQIAELDPVAWVRTQREWLAQQLSKVGGVLLRGFRISSVSEFENVFQTFAGDLMEYSYRSTPRHKVEGNIYTSTEYPEDQEIPLHNENAYASAWPMKIGFYCRKPSVSGGQTPIADSRRVYQQIDPKIRESFAAKQVMYRRNYGSGVDLPWETVFQTTDRSEVEAYCRSARIEWEWGDGDRLRTRHVRPAVARHPETGEMIWFNQAHLFHLSNLPSDVQESLLETFGEEGLPRQAVYGDGSPIEDEYLAEVRKVYAAEAIQFDWQAGDVLLLDNMLVAHSRRPYTGERSVLVAMAQANKEF